MEAEWRQNGDRMEIEWRQNGDKKMSMMSHEGFVGETFIATVSVQSMYLSNQRARKADCLSEYVVPLIF